MGRHQDATVVHVMHNYIYANAGARTGASGFVSADIGKMAHQTDNNSWWILTATTPTWAELTNVASTIPVWLPVESGRPSTTGGCADPTKVEFVTNDIDLFVADFDADADEFIQWSFKMPPDWDASTITFHAVWTAASSSGDTIWGLQGRSYADDDAIDQAWGSAQTVTDTLTATGDICVTPESSAITFAGTPAAGEFVVLRGYRDADVGGDTLAADARLIGFMVTVGLTG